MRNKASSFDLLLITTADRSLFQQYVELRRRAYHNEYPWLSEEFGFEDSADQDSIIATAAESGVVTAGARLTLSTPANRRRLPLEEGGFELKDYAPARDFDVERSGCGEISRMAVDARFGDGFEGSARVGELLCRVAAGAGVDCVFCICPEKPARINAINARRLGLSFRRLGEMKTVFGKDMWLCAFYGLIDYYRSGRRSAA